jgi:hypothetical protein
MVTQVATVPKSMGYDHPAYTTRQAALFVRAAGAAAVTAKYVAHANLIAYAATVYTQAVGAATSSYTFTGINGSATVAALSDQISLIVVVNTAAPGVTVGLATTSYGPWTITGNFVASGTYTNQIGQNQQIQLNTNSGTAGLGGIVIPQGAQYYFQGGTDTGAAEAITLDYNIQPLAAVGA